MPKWVKRLIWNLMLVVALVVFMGFVHCIPSAPKICWKSGWGFTDTFVDPDDYIGKSRLDLMDRMSTINALQKCGVLTFNKKGDE